MNRAPTIQALAAALLAGAATAADGPRHPWVTLPVPLPQPSTCFTNLKDGDRIETPFVLRFGLSRTGLAAITQAVPDTGHPHRLVNRDLPPDFRQPLPFDDPYRHVGQGQMETLLGVKPGRCTLRLLLADHNTSRPSSTASRSPSRSRPGTSRSTRSRWSGAA